MNPIIKIQIKKLIQIILKNIFQDYNIEVQVKNKQKNDINETNIHRQKSKKKNIKSDTNSKKAKTEKRIPKSILKKKQIKNIIISTKIDIVIQLL